MVSRNLNNISKLFVVGDKLKCFMTNNNVIGISQLEKIVECIDWADISIGYEIHVGQGVCESQLKKLSEKIAKKDLNEIFKVVVPEYYKKSTKCLTHKKRNQNIMISDPTKVSDSLYKCYLMLNDNCAEMSDHVTGHHIQGMVLIEAGRQMVLAVTEKYLLSNDKRVKPNFLTNNITVDFHKFIFPLQVEIECKVIDVKAAVGNNLKTNFLISFIQNGEVCVKLSCKSSVMDSDYVEEREICLANQRIKSHLNFNEARKG